MGILTIREKGLKSLTVVKVRGCYRWKGEMPLERISIQTIEIRFQRHTIATHPPTNYWLADF